MLFLTKVYFYQLNSLMILEKPRQRGTLLTLLLLIALAGNSWAQSKFIDRAGRASFFSSAPLEDIEAHSNQAVSIFDVQSGEIAASVLMRSFNFRKALMEEHFNENYIESDRYPKATFKGKVSNLSDLDVSKPGKYTLNVTGDITLHGVTRPVQVKAEVTVDKGVLQAKAVFPLKVQDFKIKVPRLVVNNIAEVVDVTVSFSYQPMK